MVNTRQKGRQLVIEVVRRMKENGLNCYEVVGSGAGKLKGDIRVESMDLVIEAKKHKVLSMSDWAKQSEREGLGYNKTALAWQIPNTPHIRMDIDIDYFCELLKRNEEPKMKELDRETTYTIKNLKIWLNKLLKQLN